MRALGLLVVAVAILVDGVYAQSPAMKVATKSLAGFAGTWVVRDDYSKIRGDLTWEISVRGPQVVITKIRKIGNSVRTRDTVLFTDGRGDVNYAYENGTTVERKSTTKFRDGKIVSVFDRPSKLKRDIDSRKDFLNFDVTEVYFLAKKGQELVFRTDNGYGSEDLFTDTRIVFKRKE